MSINVTGIVVSAVGTMFRLGSDLVRAATYVRPASFNPANGQQTSAESSASCSIFVATYKAQEFGLVTIQPGDEKVYIRASELTSITDPVKGDYIIETISGLRRDVLNSRLDPTGTLWTFQTVRGLNEDWGEISVVHSTSEDRDDLTAVTTFDDWGTLV